MSETSVDIEGVTLELKLGDIARQDDIDAVVNAANAQLRIGGGVAGALHRAAGPGLEEECRAHAPIEPGEAVITGAHELPNRWVVHCLGPVYGRDRPEDELLASCYRRALARADEAGAESIAFPAISTGAFGYPIEHAAPVALEAVVGAIPELESLRRIRFVFFAQDDLDTYRKALADG
jgi:O-acetyl-ADP-ribose deacetylase (regulator of RNase III)